MAGGKGTRLASLNEELPKPMFELCGKPVLQWQIETLRKENIKEISLVIGYKGEYIREYFGDGTKFGVNIDYFEEKSPLGTAGALFQMKMDEDFLLCGADLVFDISIKKMLRFHQAKQAVATLFVHPSSHPQDSTLLITDFQDRVIRMITPSDGNKDNAFLSNAGIQIVSPDLFKSGLCEYADLDKDVIAPAVAGGKVFAYRSPEYVKDMGTPERLAQTESDIKNGLVFGNACVQKKAVFLDRDGTVNKYKGYITNPDDIELLPGAAHAIKLMRESGYMVFLVTNQAVIARGDCDFETLHRIHCRLEYLLCKDGAFIDKIYFCPHHPEKGFEGERSEYKIKCNCRKPAPGMILKAADEFNINLSASYMAGDSYRDVEAAVNAGCVPIYLKCGKNEQTAEEMSAAVYDDLYDFSKMMFKDRKER